MHLWWPLETTSTRFNLVAARTNSLIALCSSIYTHITTIASPKSRETARSRTLPIKLSHAAKQVKLITMFYRSPFRILHYADECDVSRWWGGGCVMWVRWVWWTSHRQSHDLYVYNPIWSINPHVFRLEGRGEVSLKKKCHWLNGRHI